MVERSLIRKYSSGQVRFQRLKLGGGCALAGE
jgi:hypothetical protein